MFIVNKKVVDEFMINRTIFITPLVFLCSIIFIYSCSSSQPIGSQPTIEQAHEAIERGKIKSAHEAQQAKEEAIKKHWSMQSKEVKKRIKKTNKKRKRESRKKKRSIF